LSRQKNKINQKKRAKKKKKKNQKSKKIKKNQKKKMLGAPPQGEEGHGDFERERLENLARNQERLRELGLAQAAAELRTAAAAAAPPAAGPSKRKRQSVKPATRKEPAVTRRSTRSSGAPAATSAEGAAAADGAGAHEDPHDSQWLLTCEEYARLVATRALETRNADTAPVSSSNDDDDASGSDDLSVGDLERRGATAKRRDPVGAGKANAAPAGAETAGAETTGAATTLESPPAPAPVTTAPVEPVEPVEPVVRDAGRYRGWVAPHLMEAYGIAPNASEAWRSPELQPTFAPRAVSSAKRDSSKMLKKNPNAYFYRHVEPGLEQAFGDWSDDEHRCFVETMRKFGVGDKWGLFSTHVPRRVGYQCSSYYREVILPRGLAWDENWRITAAGEAVFVGRRPTRGPNYAS
jgi:hypothetical protein